MQQSSFTKTLPRRDAASAAAPYRPPSQPPTTSSFVSPSLSSTIVKALSDARDYDSRVEEKTTRNSSRPSSAAVILPPIASATAANDSSHSPSPPSSTFTSTHQPSQRLAALAASKESRHRAAWSEYTTWRTSFDHALADEIDHVASQLRADLDRLDAPLRKLLDETLTNESDLLRMEQHDIIQAEAMIRDTYTRKEERITSGISALRAIESRRSKECTAALETLVAKWYSIAYLTPAEIEVELAQETKEWNVHLLRNHSSTEELSVILQSELLYKQREANDSIWQKGEKKWKGLRHGRLIQKFKEEFEEENKVMIAPATNTVMDGVTASASNASLLSSRSNFSSSSKQPQIQSPAVLKRAQYDALMKLQREFTQFSDERIHYLVYELNPSQISTVLSSTDSSASLSSTSHPIDLASRSEDVLESLSEAYAKYDVSVDQCLMEIKRIEMDVKGGYDTRVEVLRKELQRIGQKSTAEIDADIAAEIIPLLSDRTTRETQLLQRIESCLKYYDTNYLSMYDSFSSFYLNAAKKYDHFVREIRLKNEQWKETLAERRDAFDINEKELEHQLSQELELLMTDPNIETLNIRLAKIRGIVGANGSLEKEYRSVFEECEQILNDHITSLQHVSSSCSSSLARHFGLVHLVDIEHERKEKEERKQREVEEAAQKEAEEDAKLPKKERMKKEKEREKLKKEREREAVLLAEQETKAKLAKLKEKMMADAHAAILLARENRGGSGSESSNSTRPGSSEDLGNSRPRSGTSRSSSNSSPLPPSSADTIMSRFRIREEDLLKEYEAHEACEHAMETIRDLIEGGVFYDKNKFVMGEGREKFLFDQRKKKPRTPLPSERGLVEIQPWELDIIVEKPKEKTEAEAMIGVEEMRARIVQPVVATVAAHTSLPEEGKRSGSSRAARRSAERMTPAPLSTATAASSSITTDPSLPTQPTVPSLTLTPNILQFRIGEKPEEVLQRMLHSDPTSSSASASSGASTTSDAVGASSTAGVSHNGSVSFRLGAGELETASEREVKERLAREREEELAAAAAAVEKERLEAEAAKEAEKRPKTSKTMSAAAKKRAAAAAAAALLAKSEAEAAAATATSSDDSSNARKPLSSFSKESSIIPLDSSSLPLLTPISFPSQFLQDRFELIREWFVLTLEHLAEEEIARVQRINSEMRGDFLSELNHRLRRHSPRYNRIEIDVYEQRAKQLNSNMISYQRFIERLTDSYASTCIQWETTLESGEKELKVFDLRIRAANAELNQSTTLPTSTTGLARLQSISTELRQHRFNIQSKLSDHIIAPLQTELEIFQKHVMKQLEGYQATMERKVFGGEEEFGGEETEGQHEQQHGNRGNTYRSGITTNRSKKSAKSATSSSMNDSTGNTSNGNDSSATSLTHVASYHPEELTHYITLLQEFSLGFSKLLETYNEKISSLQTNLSDLLTLRDFDLCYQRAMQYYSLHQGLGHRNGAPKRMLTVRMRTEMNTSEKQEEWIKERMKELEAMIQQQKGKDGKQGTDSEKVKSSTHKKIVKKEAVEEEKQSTTTSSLVASASSLDLATVFTTLPFASPPPPSLLPTFTSATPTSTRFLHTLDQLRHALYARASYLGALKPGLPNIVMTPINGRTDANNKTRTVSQSTSESKLAAKTITSEASIQPTTSSSPTPYSKRDSNGSGQGKKPVVSASSTVKPTITTPATAAAATTTSATVSTSATSPSKKSKKEEDISPDPLTQQQQQPRTFMSIVHSEIEVCRTNMRQLLRTAGTHVGEETKEQEEKKEQEKKAKKKEATITPAKDGAPVKPSSKKSQRVKDAAEAEEAPLPEAIEEHCTNELTRSEGHLARATATFTEQVADVTRILLAAGPLVLGDVYERLVSSQLEVDLSSRQTAYQAWESVNQREAQRNRDHLKPSLSSRPDQTLDKLLRKEDERHTKCVANIQSYRREMLHLLKQNSDGFVESLLGTTEALLTLMDSLLLTNDLANSSSSTTETQSPPKVEERPSSQPTVAPTKPRSAGQIQPKKKATAAALEAAAAEAAAAAALAQSLDPRYTQKTWPGIRTEYLAIPLDEEEIQQQQEEERKRKEEAAAQAAALEAQNAKAKKRAGKSAAATTSTTVVTNEDDSLKSATSSSPIPPPVTSATSASSTNHTAARRTKKQRAEDEAAAAVASAAAQLAAAQRLLIESPPITALSQPNQHAVMSTRDTIYQKFVRLFQEQVEEIIKSSQTKLAQEQKARKEWLQQVHQLTNPEPIEM